MQIDDEGTEYVPSQTIRETLKNHIGYATPTLCETVVSCMPAHRQEALNVLDDLIDRVCVSVDGQLMTAAACCIRYNCRSDNQPQWQFD